MVFCVCCVPDAFESFNRCRWCNPRSLSLQSSKLHASRSIIVIHALRVLHGPRVSLSIQDTTDNNFLTNTTNEWDMRTRPNRFIDYQIPNYQLPFNYLIDNRPTHTQIIFHQLRPYLWWQS